MNTVTANKLPNDSRQQPGNTPVARKRNSLSKGHLPRWAIPGIAVGALKRVENLRQNVGRNALPFIRDVDLDGAAAPTFSPGRLVVRD